MKVNKKMLEDIIRNVVRESLLKEEKQSYELDRDNVEDNDRIKQEMDADWNELESINNRFNGMNESFNPSFQDSDYTPEMEQSEEPKGTMVDRIMNGEFDSVLRAIIWNESGEIKQAAKDRMTEIGGTMDEAYERDPETIAFIRSQHEKNFEGVGDYDVVDDSGEWQICQYKENGKYFIIDGDRPFAKQGYDYLRNSRNDLVYFELNGKQGFLSPYNAFEPVGGLFDRVGCQGDFNMVWKEGKVNLVDAHADGVLSNTWFDGDGGLTPSGRFLIVCLGDKFNLLNSEGQIRLKEWYSTPQEACNRMGEGYWNESLIREAVRRTMNKILKK